MILTRAAIEEKMTYGLIEIVPFEQRFLNPNGYDLHLSKNLLIPKFSDPANPVWDARSPIEYQEHEILPNGFLLNPGELCLGCTIEYTNAIDTVPVFEGKSSIGRMGVDVHLCVGFGDVGFAGHWTLELRVIYPTIIYAGMPIGQLVWHKVAGEIRGDYSKVGSYAGQQGTPTPTKLWKDFDKKLLLLP